MFLCSPISFDPAWIPVAPHVTWLCTWPVYHGHVSALYFLPVQGKPYLIGRGWHFGPCGYLPTHCLACHQVFSVSVKHVSNFCTEPVAKYSVLPITTTLEQDSPVKVRSGGWGIISYPLFADADTGIYPHAASQYHARPKAKRGIAMLSVDKFPYPRKQTRGNEFIPCSNNICDILKRFRSFKIPAITLIWPKSPYKHSVTRSYRSGK